MFGFFYYVLCVVVYGLCEEGVFWIDGFLQVWQYILDWDFIGGDNVWVGGYFGQWVDVGQVFYFGDVGGIQIEFYCVFFNV